MKIKKNIIILILIIVLAALLRLWTLNQFPAGLNADEASLGYNAYSILKTGRDEYGTFLPLNFKSFGDFKPGFYVYLTIPFIATLGLNEWAIRLPSALLGILTVFLIYLLGRLIFKSEKVGLFSSLLLAISPWHLHFSRGGWESNAATFLLTAAVVLFLKSLQKPLFFFASLFVFLLSVYTYQSTRLIAPVLVLVLVTIYWRDLKTHLIKPNLKKTISALFILFIFTIPFFLELTSSQGTARFSGLSIFSDSGPPARINELRGEHLNPNGKFAQLVHNKLTAYGPNFLGHYLDHFKPDFLFISGDPLIRSKVPDTGQFYLIEALFLIVGLVVLARSNFKDGKLLISWILVAPLASSLTYQTPHALRTLNLVVPLTLVCGLGFAKIAEKAAQFKKWSVVVMVLIGVLSLFEFVHYLESYYIHYPKRYPLAWEYGFSQMVQKLEIYQNAYNKVVITDRYDQPYILVLFYEKYDPLRYQPQAVLSPRDQFNFGTVRSFDKYEFRKIDPVQVGKEKGVLYVTSEQEAPKNANIIDEVDFPNGQPAFLFISSL